MLNGRVDIMNLYFCVVSSPFGAVSFQPVCHACLYAGPRFIRDDALGNAVFARHLLYTRICRNDFSRADLAQCQGQSMLKCGLMSFCFGRMFLCFVLSENYRKNKSNLSLCRPRMFGHD